MAKRFRFDGSIYNFIGILSWALTVRQANLENHPDGQKVATDPDINRRVAEEYGITSDALLYELVRLGKEAQESLEYNLYKSDVATKLENGPEKSFIEYLLNDEVHFDDIDDFIEFWHNSYEGDKSLRDFLGFSEEEFETFAKSGQDILVKIYNERK